MLIGLVIEQMRQQKKELNKTQRQLTRDQSALERQEKQLVSLLLLIFYFYLCEGRALAKLAGCENDFALLL